MSRPAPRRPSRTTTPKPRKIAGRDVAPADSPAGAEEDQTPAAPAADKQKAASTPPKPPKPPKRETVVPADPPDGGETAGLTNPRATRVLLVLVGVFALLLVLQAVWFFVHSQRNDDGPAATSAASDGEGGSGETIAVPSGRPVVLNGLAVQEGVDAAASAAQVMFARSWKSYDKGVDDAVALMTDGFAEEYRATTDDVRAEFIRKKTQVEVRVVAQSVVRANDSELEALIFLNQYVFRGQGDDAKTTYTPYRAVLTMVHTDEGWLVDGLETQ